MNLQEIKNSNKYSMMGEYDVVVVGAGHAGCEAGLAAARIGCETLLLSMNLESVAMMPCNPSIGGTGKGHLVCEIDALGGEMGLNIDKTFIQSKMLNTSKGPAVHSLRAQADKTRYHLEMKKTIENEERLSLKQAEVVDLIIDDGAVCGVVTRTNSINLASSVNSSYKTLCSCFLISRASIKLSSTEHIIYKLALKARLQSCWINTIVLYGISWSNNFSIFKSRNSVIKLFLNIFW